MWKIKCEIHWTHHKNKTFTECIAEYFDYSTFWQCKNQKEQWSSPDMHQSLPTMRVCTLHTVIAGPWLWKGLRSVLTSDQGRQPSNGLFDAQYVNHVILFVHCAHIYFLLSVCLCAPVHVLVSQSRLFMGIWRTMRDCASLCFEPGNGHWSGNCVLGWTFLPPHNCSSPALLLPLLLPELLGQPHTPSW